MVLILSILFSVNISAADYTQGVEISGSNAVIWLMTHLLLHILDKQPE